MKNSSIPPEDDDPLDREVDLSRGRPNPYWLGVVNRRCVRLIDEDLVESFPDNESVNAALRAIAEAAKRTGGTPPKKRVSAAEKRVPKKRR